LPFQAPHPLVIFGQSTFFPPPSRIFSPCPTTRCRSFFFCKFEPPPFVCCFCVLWVLCFGFFLVFWHRIPSPPLTKPAAVSTAFSSVTLDLVRANQFSFSRGVIFRAVLLCPLVHPLETCLFFPTRINSPRNFSARSLFVPAFVFFVKSPLVFSPPHAG